MAVNNIYIGSLTTPSFFFTNEQLINVNTNMSVDAIGNELTIDTLEFKVYYDDSDSALRDLVYATPIWYYSDSNLVGKFYFNSVERVGSNYYVVNAVSVIGLMEYEKHYGGYYQNQNLKDAVNEILVSNGLNRYVPYTYSSAESGTAPIMLGDSYSTKGTFTSNSRMSVRIKFKVTKAVYFSPTGHYELWFAFADSVGRIYVTVQKTVNSDTDDNIRITCGFGPSGAYEDISFDAKYGDVIDLFMQPSTGKITYQITGTGGSSETTQYISAVSSTYTLPMCFVGGSISEYSYGTGVSDVCVDYVLYKFQLLNESGTTPYIDIIPVIDYFDGELYFKDDAGGGTYLATGYTDSGVIMTDYNVPGTITEDMLNSEIAKIADNIQWPTGIDTLTFTGWVAAGTKREVLHQILFALNLNLYKSADGNLIIGKLPDVIDGEIDEDEIYSDGSVENIKRPKKIELSEHFYAPSSDSVVVFNNTSTIVQEPYYTIEFNQSPIYGTPVGDGISVLVWNANAAIVSGTGTITATPYEHSQRIITETIDTRPDGDTVSISNAMLVTVLNSANVMNKLKAYYANDASKIKNAIILGSQKLGRKYSFSTPFFDEVNAFLLSANINTSSVTKANCEFLAGYTPVDAGNVYNNYVVLTGSGTWEVPAGVTEFYLVLIGGGTGGDSGYAGENGGTNYNWASTSPAAGGNYGNNGAGGKVYEAQVTSPSASYLYSCGTGGIGGSSSTSHTVNNPGNAGGNTTFGSFSSADGEVKANGYMNLITGDVYAATMPKWNDESGKGGSGGYVVISGTPGSQPPSSVVVRYPGESVYNFMTGETSYPGALGTNRSDGGYVTVISGSGGGAALNDNGEDGSSHPEYYTGGYGAYGTYYPPKATLYNPKYYGYGGMGGVGGGGGGSSGYDEDGYGSPGIGGVGGRSGIGGEGGDGCVLIYY